MGVRVAWAIWRRWNSLIWAGWSCVTLAAQGWAGEAVLGAGAAALLLNASAEQE